MLSAVLNVNNTKALSCQHYKIIHNQPQITLHPPPFPNYKISPPFTHCLPVLLHQLEEWKKEAGRIYQELSRRRNDAISKYSLNLCSLSQPASGLTRIPGNSMFSWIREPYSTFSCIIEPYSRFSWKLKPYFRFSCIIEPYSRFSCIIEPYFRFSCSIKP